MKYLTIKTWFSVLAAVILAAVGTGAALAQGGGGVGPFVDRTTIAEVVAEVLGLTPDEVIAALQTGQTIADLAGDQTDAVIAALVAQAEAKIDEAVANGRITEARGDLAKANLERHITAIVNGNHPGRPGGNGNPGLLLALGREVLTETVADVLGITPEEVIAALQSGQTIADLAGDQTDAVIAALVAEATVRLDEAVANGNLDAERAELMKANLEAHITALVNGEHPGRPGGNGNPGLLLALGREVLAETVAEVLGLTPDEVIAALQSGQTIAEIAGDQTDAVIAALVAEATVRLDTAVANGNLDAERAELMKANLEAHITALVNGERPQRTERPVRPGGQGGNGNGNGNGGQHGNGGMFDGLFENGGLFGLFGPTTTDSTLDQPESVTQPNAVMGRSVRRGGNR